VTIFGITILLFLGGIITGSGRLETKGLGDQTWTKPFFFPWVVSSIGRGQLEVMQMANQIWTNLFCFLKAMSSTRTLG
jgi:hypothetical protein